ncbi:MAG: inositol 2-dehydrogenase [Myxococcota bacterium]
MADAVRVGLVGAGRMGHVHARHLAGLRDVRIVAVVDVREAAARACAREVGAKAVFRTPEPVVQSPDVDALVVCSDTDTHAGLIAAAAEGGKHVFCEKPIALDLASIDRALSQVRSAGVKLQVGFNRRFDPAVRRLHEAIRSGAIGSPELLRITSRDVEPPPLDYVRRSGGLFLDMTIHDLDLARFLAGSEVRRVHAAGSVCVDPGIGEAGDVDTAVVSLEFQNGVLATIDNSRRSVYGYDQRVELFGSRGLLTSGDALTGLVQAPARPPSRQAQLERYLDSYRLELEAFVACVREDAPPPVDGDDARRALALALAARLSLRESRAIDPAAVSA